MQSDSTRPVRVLIADDHPVVREGLRGLIATEPGIEVVGEAADGVEAVRNAVALQPDVVLLDLVMPLKDGIAVIGEIRQVAPGTQVLVLTSYAEDEKLFPALKAGALGYLLKDTHPQELLAAIQRVARGQPWLSPTATSKALHVLDRLGDPAQPDESLTERETEVLGLVAEGLSNQEIADRLGLSERTARTHVSHILRKLGLANRTQVALFALKQGKKP